MSDDLRAMLNRIEETQSRTRRLAVAALTASIAAVGLSLSGAAAAKTAGAHSEGEILRAEVVEADVVRARMLTATDGLHLLGERSMLASLTKGEEGPYLRLTSGERPGADVPVLHLTPDRLWFRSSAGDAEIRGASLELVLRSGRDGVTLDGARQWMTVKRGLEFVPLRFNSGELHAPREP